MVDAAKMAVKAGLIVGVVVIITGIFVGLQVPLVAMGNFGTAIGKGIAIAEYWFPLFRVWFGVGLVLLGLEITILLARVALIAIRWIFKVNE